MRRLLPVLILLSAFLPHPATPAETAAVRVGLARINQIRAAHGLAPVAPDALLARAARRHAEDMARNDFFGHVGSDGSNSGSRVDDAGFHWRLVAENVAAGPADANEVVAMWMRSPGHRHNLLSPGVTRAGFAWFRIDPDPGNVVYRNYWVLVLAAPQKAH